MIRFLLDAQLSRQLVRSGYSATHVFDHLAPQADDRAIAELANELDACVMSKDADFADLANRARLRRTLIWLRVYNIDNNMLWLRVEPALPLIVRAVNEKRPIFEVF